MIWKKLTNKEIVELLKVRLTELDADDFGYDCTKILYGSMGDWWRNTLNLDEYKIRNGELYKRVD